MPNAPTQTRRTGEQASPRPAPFSPSLDSPGESELYESDVRQSLGAMGLVCRSVFLCGLGFLLTAALLLLGGLVL